MDLIFTNYLSREKSMIELKNFFITKKIKWLSIVYGIWIIISTILAYLQPHKYASYFTDIPNDLKTITPFLFSLAYLTLFIPGVILMVLFALYILFFAIRSIYKN
ncbi:MAG: hypothetical protein NTZ27_10030 [Ignavibacteriales bacterium]|nr:hypothetical protein [Ignavibacteriales bacterium]